MLRRRRRRRGTSHARAPEWQRAANHQAKLWRPARQAESNWAWGFGQRPSAGLGPYPSCSGHGTCSVVLQLSPQVPTLPWANSLALQLCPSVLASTDHSSEKIALHLNVHKYIFARYASWLAGSTETRYIRENHLNAFSGKCMWSWSSSMWL